MRPRNSPARICGGPMEYKLSKNGRFMSCKRFPECLGARKEDGSEIAPPKELDEPCPHARQQAHRARRPLRQIHRVLELS